MALIKCPECGKEISDKANSCPNCGCPIGTDTATKESISTVEVSPSNKQGVKIKKFIPLIIGVVVVAIIGIIIYNVKVVQPKKIEAQNKATYEEAIALLEKGKYEDGNELLQSIAGYEDVDTILEQIKWESRVYECITDIRQYLKNPDSLQVYEVVFYDGYKADIDDTKKELMEDIVNLAGGEPVCVMHRGGQNGFGGNTTGYSLFLYSDGVYKYVGSCDTLNEEDIDDDDKEELAICGLINIYKDNLEQVGDVDLARIKTIIKNDSYSTIKIIE